MWADNWSFVVNEETKYLLWIYTRYTRWKIRRGMANAASEENPDLTVTDTLEVARYDPWVKFEASLAPGIIADLDNRNWDWI